jgi:hypothetical protein
MKIVNMLVMFLNVKEMEELLATRSACGMRGLYFSDERGVGKSQTNINSNELMLYYAWQPPLFTLTKKTSYIFVVMVDLGCLSWQDSGIVPAKGILKYRAIPISSVLFYLSHALLGDGCTSTGQIAYS